MRIADVDPKNLPDTKEVVDELKKRAHAFLLQVRNESSTGGFWRRMYGKDNLVVIPTTEYLPFVKAAIIGLTEGTLNLQTVGEFLEQGMGKAGVSKSVRRHQAGSIKDEADKIVRAVSGIPIGAQAALPNFDKIPARGSVFANRGDLWPIDDGKSAASKKPAKRRTTWE